MNGRNLLIVSVLYIFILLVVAPTAYGSETPDFPSCVNPKGTIKASYENGTHGIPGDTKTYTGKDTVYQTSDTTLMQCLCPKDGAGIQTNWWKANKLNKKEIKVFTSQGWIYIADGSAWGLDKAPYLAKNKSFSCKPSSVGGAKDEKSDSKGSSKSEGKGGGVPAIFELANTGNMAFILSVITLGITSIAAGLLINRKKN